MLKKVLGLFALSTTIVVASACGGDDPPAEKYPTADSFCIAKAAEECKVVSPVCAVTDGVCNATRKGACLSAASGASGQGRTYTASQAEACIAKTTEVYKDRVVDPVKEKSFNETCERVFAGSKKLSEGCSQIYECASPLVCDVEKGACANKIDKKLDEPCNNPGDICGTGLYCQQRGANKFCTARNKQGDACSAEAPCLETLRCVNQCVPLQKAGEACDTSAECETKLCNSDRKCAARLFPTENGSCKDFGGT